MKHLWIPGLPPSANNAYFNLPQGGRSLTTAGKKFLTETKAYLSQNFPAVLFTMKKNTPYMLYVRLWLSALENIGYSKGKTDSRYKKIDAGNRLKLLEDALKDVCGTDDSQHLVVVLEKRQSLVGEFTEIFLWDMQDGAITQHELLRVLGDAKPYGALSDVSTSGHPGTSPR